MAVLGGLAVLVGSAVLQRWEPPETTPVTAEIVANPGERVIVQVLNNGGLRGMAAAATEVLREAGFDVVESDNLQPFDRENSVVLARGGRLDMASRVADALAIAGYRDEPDSTVYVDVTVLLGTDWSPEVVVERAAEREQAQDTIVAPTPPPDWRGVLSRLRKWAEGLNQAGSQ